MTIWKLTLPARWQADWKKGPMDAGGKAARVAGCEPPDPEAAHIAKDGFLLWVRV